jgi:hypothetical protein
MRSLERRRLTRTGREIKLGRQDDNVNCQAGFEFTKSGPKVAAIRSVVESCLCDVRAQLFFMRAQTDRGAVKSKLSTNKARETGQICHPETLFFDFSCIN